MVKRQQEGEMNIIAAVDKHWAIGYQGKTLVDIPADRKLFREETMGKVVVMGRKTLESLPGGQPLAKRMNIILSRDTSFSVRGALVCRSPEEALKECEQYPSEDIFIAGGQEIYQQFLPFCSIAHITWIDYAYQADTYFPDLDRDGAWQLTAASEEQTCFDLCYEFRLYCRKEKLKGWLKAKQDKKK